MVCLACKWITWRESGFCKGCEETAVQLLGESSNMEVCGYPFRVRALFSWSEVNSIFVKQIITSFKGGAHKKAADWFAFQMTVNFILRVETPKPRVIIPCPPSSVNRFGDHALSLAKRLNNYTSWSVMPVLELLNADGEPQKVRKQNSRYRRSMVSESNMKGQAILFVDDVVTSGATAQAAWLALGKPQSFEVWSLAHRPRILDNKRDGLKTAHQTRAT